MSAFVRSLWGDAAVGRYDKCLEDVRRWISHPLRESPLVVYAFGIENERLLKEAGVACALAHENACVDFHNTKDRSLGHEWGMEPYGVAMWRHKIEAMLVAMRKHDEIIWLDWDCHLMQELPADFWQRMRQGAAVQMSLVGYRHKLCRHRAYDRAITPEGAFIYCRDVTIVQRVAELYLEYPRVNDQKLWSMVIEELMPGWEEQYPHPANPRPFVAAYNANGFEPYCQRLYNQITPPVEQVFATSRGRSHRHWMWKRKRVSL